MEIIGLFLCSISLCFFLGTLTYAIAALGLDRTRSRDGDKCGDIVTLVGGLSRLQSPSYNLALTTDLRHRNDYEFSSTFGQVGGFNRERCALLSVHRFGVGKIGVERCLDDCHQWINPRCRRRMLLRHCSRLWKDF